MRGCLFGVFVGMVAAISPVGTDPSCKSSVSLFLLSSIDVSQITLSAFIEHYFLPTRNMHTVSCGSGLFTGPEDSKRNDLLPQSI